jgi:hypothetical protein
MAGIPLRAGDTTLYSRKIAVANLPALAVFHMIEKI